MRRNAQSVDMNRSNSFKTFLKSCVKLEGINICNGIKENIDVKSPVVRFDSIKGRISEA